jgi:predicted O-methyltransferase YrrM
MMDQREPTPENFGNYVGGLFAREDEALRAARAEMEREGLPKINVSASEGTLLHILARAVGARRILEIGTLGGYSATWLARALPEEGRLISLEIDEHHAEVARRNLARAGLAEKVEVRVGPAAESLDALAASGEDAFDLVFIDADKDGYPTYLEKSVPLVRAGGLIVADNVLQPAVLDPDADTGITRYNAALAARPDLVSIITPTLGRGLGGLSISVKRSAAS